MANDTKSSRFPGSVVIRQGAFVDEGVILEDGVIIGANASVLAKDETTGVLAPAVIRAGAVIGANAIILPGITIGQKAVIRPGPWWPVPSHPWR